VSEIVWRGRLTWFGYVERKADDWVKKCIKVEVVGKIGKGRGRVEVGRRGCSVLIAT